MRVLLINPFSSYKLSGIRFQLPNPSLAAVYAIIKNSGFEADLCDFQALDEPNLIFVDSFLQQHSYGIIGISANIDSIEHVSDLITHIRKINSQTPILIGGATVTHQPEMWVRETGADIAVIGEAEITLPELLSAIKANSDIDKVSGIAYRKDSKILKTARREPLKSLKNVPFPDYSLFNLESYFGNPNMKFHFNGKNGLYLMVSRGCPYRCSFCCSWSVSMRTFETRRIIDEIDRLISYHRLESIFVRDDNFTLNPKRAKAIAQALGKAGISWTCMSRPNLLNRGGDKQLLEYMAENGCETVMTGVESYNQQVLDINCKDISVADVDAAIDNCQKTKIRTVAFIIFGLPGETEESISQTLRFIERSGVQLNSSILQVLPGTPIYTDAIKQGKILDEIRYLKDFHYFWDSEKFLPANMTCLPDDVIIHANKEANRVRLKSKFLINY